MSRDRADIAKLRFPLVEPPNIWKSPDANVQSRAKMRVGNNGMHHFTQHLLRVLASMLVLWVSASGAGGVAHAQPDHQAGIKEAQLATVHGDALLASGNDVAAIREYHRALIALGAKVPSQPYVGDDAEGSYAEVRIDELTDTVLVGDLLGRVAEAYLHRVFDAGGRTGNASASPDGQRAADPLGLLGHRHGHGMAATKASIRVLESALKLILEKASFAALHERRDVAQLLRRAYDLEIDDLVDLEYTLGGAADDPMPGYLLAKVMHSRSLTLLEALWLRRLSFTRVISRDELNRMTDDFVALLARWTATGLRFGYLRDALLSEMRERKPRSDVVAQLRSEYKLARADVLAINHSLTEALVGRDKQVIQSLRLLMYPHLDVSAGAAFGAGFFVNNRLKSSDVLIQYHETSRQLLAFVYDPAKDLRDAVTMLPLSRDPAAVARAVDDFNRHLKQPGSPLWQSAASSLYLRLIAPLAPYLPGKKQIFIVPSGSLNTLPFQALIDPREGEPPRIALLPHAELLGPGISAPPLTADRTRALVIGISEFWSQPPLERAEAEAIGVAARFGRNATLLLGSRAEATKANILQQMPLHGVIHIASHASFDRRAMNSEVVVRGDADLDERISGFDVLRPEVRLDGALVTLSACDTGGLQVDRGEDPLGLASGLLIAGARAVVASHWQVADRAAELVMARFYDELTRGESAGSALARATTWLRTEKPEYAHPHYWAAFVVIGDSEWQLPGAER
jgi:CHAT domain-containing protein